VGHIIRNGNNTGGKNEMGFDVTHPINIGEFLLFLVLLAAPDIATAQTMYATSGAGRGDLGSARLNAMLAVEKDRIDKAEACANAGQLYGPNFAGNKSAAGCLTDLTVNTTGGITVSGNSTFNNSLAVTGTSAFTGNVTMAGTLAVTGTVSGAAPTANNHLTTKEYVDTAAASGGGGSGGGAVGYLGLTAITSSGLLNGLSGANNKCSALFGPGARMMTLSDYFASGRTSNFPSAGWLNCGDAISIYNDKVYCGSVFMGTHSSPENMSACGQWTSSNAAFKGTSLDTAGRIVSTACSTALPIHCVGSGGTAGDIQVFIGTSGTWNKPPSGSSTVVRCWGGGGGGSYAGGGGGGYNTDTIATNTLPATVAVTVGGGGGAGNAGSSNGGNGGNTTFGGYLTAYGGGGGSGGGSYIGGGGGGVAGPGQNGASGGAGGAGIGGVGLGGNGVTGGTAGGGGGGGSPGINGANGSGANAGGSNGGSGSGGGGGYIGGGSVGARGLSQNGGGDGSPGGSVASGCPGGGPAGAPGGGGAGCNTGTAGAPGGCIVITN